MNRGSDSALQAVRRRHELRVLEAIVANGSRTRKDLEIDTNLSRTTLSAIVGDLRQRGVVVEADPVSYGTGRNGRPTKVLTLDPKAAATVGIELGRRRVAVSLIAFDGTVIESAHRALDTAPSLSEKVSIAAVVLSEMIKAGQLSPELVIGMGVGIASRHANRDSLADGSEQQADPQGGTLKPLRDILDVPLLWDNNIRLAAIAQAAKPGEGGDLLYVVLSAGISSAVVVDGALLRGGNGIAGELGHISVDFDGPDCWCGRRGCLERFLNEPNVLIEAATRGQAFDSIAAIAKAAQAGNQIAGDIIDWAGELLARAVVSACVLIDPGKVVVAGELAQFGERLLNPVRLALQAQHLDIGPRQTEITTASFSPTAGSSGAGVVALKRWAFDAL